MSVIVNRMQHKGFTIVELLIVIVVLGILAAITIVAYNNVQERAYSSRVIATVDAYSKALKMYHITNGKFPTYGTNGSTCLGRVSDYPAADGFPAGACMMWTNTFGPEYANDTLYNEIKTIMPSMPDPTTRVAEENYPTRVARYRGIYYEYTNNPPGSSYPDWAYVEYVVKGKVPCPKAYSTRFGDGDNNITFCSQIINAQDTGID